MRWYLPICCQSQRNVNSREQELPTLLTNNTHTTLHLSQDLKKKSSCDDMTCRPLVIITSMIYSIIWITYKTGDLVNSVKKKTRTSVLRNQECQSLEYAWLNKFQSTKFMFPSVKSREKINLYTANTWAKKNEQQKSREQILMGREKVLQHERELLISRQHEVFLVISFFLITGQEDRKNVA